MGDIDTQYDQHEYARAVDEIARLIARVAELKAALGEYVVLGAGKCTISKAHADMGLTALKGKNDG